MAAKMHWKDRHGPICGVKGHQVIVAPADLREVTNEQLSCVTCKNCIKKLREWGFAMQHFTALVNETIK